jgi:hypothetical protein
MDDTKAAVAKPAFFRTSASSGTSGTTAGEMLSRMPVSEGRRPVNTVTWEGRVRGTWDEACGAIAPSRARASRCGVAAPLYP